MKRLSILVLVLALALFSTPAMAALSISCTGFGNTITVSYAGNGTTAATRARAFAMDISLSGGKTIGTEPAGDSTADYYIYLGSIDINATSDNVDSWGTPVGAGGSGSSSMTTEQGSLYDATDTSGHTTPPGAAGTLLIFTVSGATTVTITENASRGGVVMEDGSSAGLGSPVCTCSGGTPPYANTCWDITECPGQPSGDSTCDGSIDFGDLGDLSEVFGTVKGDALYNCCVDYNQDEAIDFSELGTLSANFGTSGYGGTSNQNCPP